MGSTSHVRGWALLLLLLGCGLPAAAVDWPTNVVTVSDSATDAECTALNTPHECCDGNAADPDNFCDGYEGADIKEGLNTCQTAGGCILKLPCNATFTNADINILREANVTTDDRHQIADSGGFPNGLVIQGCGSSTVLLGNIPPIFQFFGHFTSAGILIFDPEPSFPIPRLALRDFVVDGQKDKQPAWDHDTLAWPSLFAVCGPFPENCIGEDNPHGCCNNPPSVPHTCAPWGCKNLAAGIIGQGPSPTVQPGDANIEFLEVKRVEVRQVVGHAFNFNGVDQSVVTGNHIHDVGCMQDFGDAQCLAGPGVNKDCIAADLARYQGSEVFQDCCTGFQTGTCTPFSCCTGAGVGTCDELWANGIAVAGELECGCNAGTEGSTCYQWNHSREFNPPQYRGPGQKVAGAGLTIGGSGRTVIANNRVDRVWLHYGLNCNSGGGDATLMYASDLCRVHENTLDNANVMCGTHCSNQWVSKNTFTNTGINGAVGTQVMAIGSSGVKRRHWVIDNDIQSEAFAMQLEGWVVKSSLRRALRIDGNRIHGSGLWHKDQWNAGYQNNSTTLIKVNSNFGGPPNCSGGPEFPTSTEIVDNEITNDNVGGHGVIRVISNIQGSEGCVGDDFRPLVMSGSNIFWAPTWNDTSQNPNPKLVIGDVRAFEIRADGVQLNAPGSDAAAWTWLSPSTGDCDGWMTNNSTKVTDSSGNSIGDCEP